MPRARRLLVLAGVALAVLTGCQPQAAPAAAPPLGAGYRPLPDRHPGGTMVFSDWEFPDTLNLLSATAETDLRVGALVFAPLWGLDSNLDPFPSLVREVPTLENGDVKVAPDGKTMTVDVKLVSGLRWSDGEPITADDVIFTWQAICDPATQVVATVGFDRIRSMDRVSDSELTWTFAPEPRGYCGSPADIPSGVYAPYLQIGPVMWVMPKHRLEKVRRQDWLSDRFFMQPDAASGPFSVSEVVPGDLIILTANPHFADGRSAPGAYTGKGGPAHFTHAPNLDKIVYKNYSGRDAMLAGLQAGESDLGFHLGPADIHALSGFTSSTAVVTGSLRDEFLNPNHGLNTDLKRPPPWVNPAGAEDTALLDALDRAIDRTAIVKQALDGEATPSAGLYPVAMRSYAEAGAAAPVRDLEAGRRALDGDGWGAGADGVRRKDGRSLDFTLLTACDSPYEQRIEQLLVKQWADLGASVKGACRPRTAFFASFGQGGVNATGAFDMSLYSNTWTPDPGSWAAFGASSQIPSASSPAGQNWDRCSDPGLDRDFADLDTRMAGPARRHAYLAVSHQWLAYHCTIPLFDWPQVRQVSNRVRNFSPNAGISMDVWNAADWFLTAT